MAEADARAANGMARVSLSAARRPRRRIRDGSAAWGFVFLAILIVLAAIFLFPLLWMLVTSLRPTAELYRYPPTIIPREISLGNYVYVLTQVPDFGRYFLNSIVVTAATVVLVVLSSMLGGYAFGIRQFRGKNGLFLAILFILGVPYIMYLIPIYLMEQQLHLINSWIGLILPYTALELPWGLLIMRGAFETIPKDMQDAAVIDGCGEFRMWVQVLVPITRPALATTTIIIFVFAWQEFMFASTLMTSNTWQTLPVGVAFIKNELQSLIMGNIGAMVVMTIVPVLAVFLAFRSFFIQGLSEGMLKE